MATDGSVLTTVSALKLDYQAIQWVSVQNTVPGDENINWCAVRFLILTNAQIENKGLFICCGDENIRIFVELDIT